MKKILMILSALVMAVSVLGAKNVDVTSPDGTLKVSVSVTDRIRYSVYSGTDLLIRDCEAGMTLRDRVLGENTTVRSIRKGSLDETSEPVVAIKEAVVSNHCNTLLINMKGDYAIEFRVFDDGMAYRFVTRLEDEIEVLGETLDLGFPQGGMAHISMTGGFKSSYEEPYTHIELDKYGSDDKMSYLPVLFGTSGSVTGREYSILLSEADLYDYPCMFIKSNGKGGITSLFPKCPLETGEDGDRSVSILKEADYIAKTSGSRSFPWRFMVITDDARDIPSNQMVYNLSSPCAIEDWSWIKPGQVSWEWWNGASVYGPDVDFVSGFNMDTYKYFIDFASAYGIPYILMDEGWAMSTRDPYTPNPTVDVHEIIRYGKEKGVGVMLWLTWLTVENNFDLFSRFSDWGVAGVKIDFMDRSDQWMVNFYERVAKEAAKHKLLIDFHGSFKPAGLEKKYPNILSYEGVRGMEQMRWCIPDNSLYLPFMRNAVGPMDYTPGAMISMQPEVYQSQRPNSASMGTRAYQMALYVVFESGIQMLADSPTLYYRNHDCTEFISSVPVVWDESIVLDAKIGEYIVIARRSGGKWYIGAICNGKEKERSFTIDLSFLGTGDRDFTMTSFSDAVNSGRQAMDYRKNTATVKAGGTVDIRLVRNGGWAAVIK